MEMWYQYLYLAYTVFTPGLNLGQVLISLATSINLIRGTGFQRFLRVYCLQLFKLFLTVRVYIYCRIDVFSGVSDAAWRPMYTRSLHHHWFWCQGHSHYTQTGDTDRKTLLILHLPISQEKSIHWIWAFLKNCCLFSCVFDTFQQKDNRHKRRKASTVGKFEK